MNIRKPLIVASVVWSSTWALGAETDRPRPDLWDRYPQIKQEVDCGLAKLKYNLAALEPEAFSAKHPELARMAQSKDWAQRIRALRAIAALEDPTGIPFLVAGIQDANDEKTLFETVDVLTTWIATRSPRDRFRPLAPLFLNILVNAPDWPNVRCRCLQALGNLADADWLPIIKELLVSRHPAVTNMSTWVIQQVSSRTGAGVCTETAEAPDTRFADGKLGEEELAAIVRKIKRLIQSPPADRDDDQVFHSDDIAWHDGWIPMSVSLRDKPPATNYLRTWRYRAGRVCSVTVTQPGREPWVEAKAWYNPAGAPILLAHISQYGQPCYFRWGEYDGDGLLLRVINLEADYSLDRFSVHDNGPKYSRTVIRDFDAQGRLITITRCADRKVIYTDVRNAAAPKVINHGHRIDLICKMEDFGLAPFYPIPSGPMEAEPNAPPGSMPRIESVKVLPVRVEQQCRAEVVVSGPPAGAQAPPTVMSDSIMIRIYDSRCRLIFRAGHGWSGLKPGQSLTLKTDTHSNTLRAAGGKPFLFPEPGRYTLSITACHGDSGRWTDSTSVAFHVGMDESEFKVFDNGEPAPAREE